jgi:hypothetical protein
MNQRQKIRHRFIFVERLPQPAKTIVAVAGFAGLREAELRGHGGFRRQLHTYCRSVWRTHTNETKTPASQSMVPVIHPLKALLDEHRYRVGRSTGWMFAGPKNGFSLTWTIWSREPFARLSEKSGKAGTLYDAAWEQTYLSSASQPKQGKSSCATSPSMLPASITSSSRPLLKAQPR